MDAITHTPAPVNEPVRGYAPGSAERESLQRRVTELAADRHELPMTIAGRAPDGRRRARRGRPAAQPQARPRRHRNATAADVADAVAAAKAAAPAWRALPFDERAAVILRAADLLSGPWRDTVNAATLLGQSKSVQQAEIDAACELIDFWRFNVHFARQILAEQPPANSAGSGTAPTTGRWTASSPPSPRSTSPPSPATCRPRRR